MSNIRVEMVYYEAVKQYVVMVLFDDVDGISSSICRYPKNKRAAEKQLAALKSQYNVA